MTTLKNDRHPLLPLGALAAGFSIAGAAAAQTAPAEPPAADAKEAVMPAVRAKANAERTGKDTLRTTTTNVGKGNQALRDIPQSVTVVTEKLMDDRNLDDFKEVLRTTAGVTFVAGETGEEDIRLRGFSLQQAGDIYIDGLRDAPLYERDTFNADRIEVLKGSASMLFGRGSTGGIVNQVNKRPLLVDQHEVNLTVGSGNLRRISGDFNLATGETSAVRINAMAHKADNWGATVDKKGIAPSVRWGIGTSDEFLASWYHLEANNRPNYNHPWFLSDGTSGRIQPVLPAKNYYGLNSDRNNTSADYGTLQHLHRFGEGSELKTTLRHGRFERDLWASNIRFAPTASQPGGVAVTPATLSGATVLTRAPKGRVGTSDITVLQSEYSGAFQALGQAHYLIAGVELSTEDAKRNNNFTTNPGVTVRNTTVGTPNNGDSVVDNRGAPPLNTFQTKTASLYAQDMLSLTQTFKLVGGVRFDHFKADYQTPAGATFSRNDSLWSPRVGALWQPSETASYYASFGTSYNVSGDAYQYAVGGPDLKTANTGPEKSRNLEIGGKFELLDNRLSLGAALFRSEKYNERNTDPDVAATQQLLSGKRHATGMEFNAVGRLSPLWEVYANWTWIPEAKIDKSNVQAVNANGTPNNAQREGDRSALTPKHSGSVWSTYRVAERVRLGGGVNFRSTQNPEGARQVTAPGFATVDLMGEYTFTDNVSAKLLVSNVTDKLYADQLYRGFYMPGAPRTVQLSLKARF